MQPTALQELLKRIIVNVRGSSLSTVVACSKQEYEWLRARLPICFDTTWYNGAVVVRDRTTNGGNSVGR